MSDKYYLHDCNSYIHSCQNTYRIERKDVQLNIEIHEEMRVKQEQLTWWQRLRGEKMQEAKT